MLTPRKLNEYALILVSILVRVCLLTNCINYHKNQNKLELENLAIIAEKT